MDPSDSLPSPQTTLVIILGASEFPKSPDLGPNEAFRRSAEELRDYFLDQENGFGLPTANLKWLFNSDEHASSLDEQVSDFIVTRSKELEEQGHAPRDVIVYYVGHGDFDPGNDSEYYLVIRQSRPKYTISGYTAKTLAKTLKETARHLRKYIILDSCFAASAYKQFQSPGPLQVAVKQVQDLLDYGIPYKGTALLCASGPRNPAKALPGHPHTMFSGALLSVLRDGVPNGPETLSLEHIGHLVEGRIRENFHDEAVRPQVHSPDQMRGDIAKVGIFPNIAKVDFINTEELAELPKESRQTENKTNESDRNSRKESVIYLSTGSPFFEVIRLFKPHLVYVPEWQSLPIWAKTMIRDDERIRQFARLFLILVFFIALISLMLAAINDMILSNTFFTFIVITIGVLGMLTVSILAVMIMAVLDYYKSDNETALVLISETEKKIQTLGADQPIAEILREIAVQEAISLPNGTKIYPRQFWIIFVFLLIDLGMLSFALLSLLDKNTYSLR